MRDGLICFADAELGTPAGDEFGFRPVGLAAALARHGARVHLLACGEGEDAAAAMTVLREAGVTVHRLEELSIAPGATVQRYGGDDPNLVLGERALEALELLHHEHHFRLIEFPEAGAVGMRAVQAKCSGDAFSDVLLAVRLRRPASGWSRPDAPALGAPRELKLKYCEHYAVEHADVRLGERTEDPSKVKGGLAELYRSLLVRPVPRAAASERATVTVVVAHYNQAPFLAGALASLASQTRPPDEVIVVDDGSTSEAALRVFAEQQALHSDWTFVRQDNAGPGPARNRGLELASSAYLLPFDSDNVAVPTMVERLARAMELNPSRAATTCHNLAFTDDEEIATGQFSFRYSPTGGPRILACVENVYGDTCSIFRTEALRSVGGFEVNRWSPTEDWETFVKLAVRGFEIDVLPRPLFYYRTDSGGRLQSLGTDRRTQLRLREHLVKEFFVDAELSELERRRLFECLQAFDDFVTVGVENRLAEQRRWHDSQMAELDAFRERQLELQRTELDTRAEAERARADRAQRELAALSRATSGWLMRRMLRWRMR